MRTDGSVWEGSPRQRWRDRVLAACLIAACLAGGLLARTPEDPVALPVLPAPADTGVPSNNPDQIEAAGQQVHPAAADGSLVRNNPDVRAVLVAVDGRPTIARYYRGAVASDLVDVGAITKSVVSLLVGIALGEGAIPALDAPLGDLLPARHLAGAAPGTPEITVEQLATMTAALPGGPGAPDFRSSRDWVGAILAGGTFTSPGTAFSDSDASSHLLSAVVAESTGRSTAAYAGERLFAPLGIDPASSWETDPQGYHLGFGGLRLRAEDLLVLGKLVLHHGRWAGRQLVPASYLRAATRPSALTGASDRYGYQWEIGREGPHVALRAWDPAGHLLEVVPTLGLVVVVTSRGAGDAAGANLESIRSFIRRELVAALAPTAPQPPVPSPSSS